MTQASSKTIGKLGQGLNFDNNNDLISIPNFQITNGAISICTWIKPNSKSSSNYGRIVTDGASENTSLFIDTSNRLGFTSNNSNVLYSPALVYGRWMQVCATRDATGANSFIYQNGVQTAAGNTGTPGVNGTVTYIGNRNDAARTFDGVIDDVRIYNRQLSAQEVKALYKLSIQYRYPVDGQEVLKGGNNILDLPQNKKFNILYTY